MQPIILFHHPFFVDAYLWGVTENLKYIVPCFTIDSDSRERIVDFVLLQTMV